MAHRCMISYSVNVKLKNREKMLFKIYISLRLVVNNILTILAQPYLRGVLSTLLNI